MNQQTSELEERAKVIAELKNSISDMINKYNKLKIEFEKQKEYNIQLNINLRNCKKRGSLTPSHTSINAEKNNKFIISHFAFNFTYKNNNNKKKLKLKNDNLINELKKLNEEFNKFKNAHDIEIDKLTKELNNKNNDLEEINNKLNIEKENYDKKVSELDKEINDLKNINNKSKQEKENIINDYNKKMHILNEDLKKMMLENEKLQNKIKSNNSIINKQKEEIERLKKNSQLNFKMIKEDNENLLKQINLLNDNFLQIEMKKNTSK